MGVINQIKHDNIRCCDGGIIYMYTQRHNNDDDDDDNKYVGFHLL